MSGALPYRSVSPTKPPFRVPGGQAKSALPVCLMYSLSASFRAKALLERHELRLRVALEADEEEAGVELAEAGVHAVGEGVAAPQDPDAVVLGAERRAGCARRAGTTARPVASCAARSTGSNSCRPPSGAPLCLWRPIVPSWSASAGAVPDLDQHPDAAGDQVACRRASSRAGRRGRPRRVRRARAVSSSLRLLVPSLKPIRLRGVSWRAAGRRGAAEAELRPAHDDGAAADPREVAHGVEGDLRVVGAGLHAEVAAASGRARARRRRSAAARASAAGRLRGEPEAVVAVRRTASARSRT